MTTKTKMRVSQGERAKNDIKEVRALGKKLGYTALMSAEEMRATGGGMRAPAKIVELAAAAWDAHGKLTGVQSFDADGARQSIAYRAAREPMVSALEELHKQGSEDIRRNYAPHGRDALALYKTMRAASETKEGAVMKSDVRAMERVMSRPRKSKGTTSTSTSTSTMTKTTTKGNGAKATP